MERKERLLQCSEAADRMQVGVFREKTPAESLLGCMERFEREEEEARREKREEARKQKVDETRREVEAESRLQQEEERKLEGDDFSGQFSHASNAAPSIGMFVEQSSANSFLGRVERITNEQRVQEEEEEARVEVERQRETRRELRSQATREEERAQARTQLLNSRALKKWNMLDRNMNNTLEGEELLALAEWVWCSFRPGQVGDGEAWGGFVVGELPKSCLVQGPGCAMVCGRR